MKKSNIDLIDAHNGSWIYRHPVWTIIISISVMSTIFIVSMFFYDWFGKILGIKILDIPSSFSDLGSALGSLNAFFSSLAFVVLIIAIFLQREDLQQQRFEYKKSIQESKVQTDEFEKQNKNMEKQIFNGLFFSAINQINDVKREITIVIERNNVLNYDSKLYDVTKRAFPDLIYINFFNFIQDEEYRLEISQTYGLEEFNEQKFSAIWEDLTDQNIECIKYLFDHFFGYLDQEIDNIHHYFMITQKVLQLVDENKSLNSVEKKSYFELWFYGLPSSEKNIILICLLYDNLTGKKEYGKFFYFFFFKYEIINLMTTKESIFNVNLTELYNYNKNNN